VEGNVSKWFDPINALARRGVRVRLCRANAEPYLMVLYEKRYRDRQEEKTVQRWVDKVLSRYRRLVWCNWSLPKGQRRIAPFSGLWPMAI
jgi:hypothetical protein